MTAEQARDQIVHWCAARGASIDQAAADGVTCSGLPVALANAPATSGSPRRYQLQAIIDTQTGGIRVTAWPYISQPSERDRPADQRREVQAMLDDLHPGAADTGGPAVPVAPPAARPEDGAAAQPSELVGVASVTDGDTIEIHGTAIRLSGFDAPEHGRRCEAVSVGQQSALALSDFIGTQTVHCTLTGARTHERYVATCSVGGVDLGDHMVERGWARDWLRFSHGAYADEEARARAAHRGLWGLACPANLWGNRNYSRR